MRSAYSGTQGFHPHGAPIDSANPGYDQGADRLSNIRRSIDSIEQRLMGAAAPVAGYGQPAAPVYAPGHMAPHYPQMGMQPAPQYQPPYGQPMGHAPAGVMYPPQVSTAHQMDHIGNEIAKRQQMLNAASNNSMAPAAAAEASARQTDSIGEQLSAVKRELALSAFIPSLFVVVIVVVVTWRFVHFQVNDAICIITFTTIVNFALRRPPNLVKIIIF